MFTGQRPSIHKQLSKQYNYLYMFNKQYLYSWCYEYNYFLLSPCFCQSTFGSIISNNPLHIQTFISRAIVKMLNGALHYSTRTERSLNIGFSLCAVPTSYFVKYFRCVLGTPRILEVSEGVQEFGSKSGTGALSRERGAWRSSMKLDIWSDKGFSRSP